MNLLTASDTISFACCIVHVPVQGKKVMPKSIKFLEAFQDITVIFNDTSCWISWVLWLSCSDILTLLPWHCIQHNGNLEKKLWHNPWMYRNMTAIHHGKYASCCKIYFFSFKDFFNCWSNGSVNLWELPQKIPVWCFIPLSASPNDFK